MCTHAGISTSSKSVNDDGGNGRHHLGCAFRFLFRFLPGLIFRNSGYSAEFPGSVGTQSELNHSRARLICSGIPEGRTLDMVYSVPHVTNIQ